MTPAESNRPGPRRRHRRRLRRPAYPFSWSHPYFFLNPFYFCFPAEFWFVSALRVVFAASLDGPVFRSSVRWEFGCGFRSVPFVSWWVFVKIVEVHLPAFPSGIPWNHGEVLMSLKRNQDQVSFESFRWLEAS